MNCEARTQRDIKGGGKENERQRLPYVTDRTMKLLRQMERGRGGWIKLKRRGRKKGPTLVCKIMFSMIPNERLKTELHYFLKCHQNV